MARAHLKWTLEELAKRAGVGLSTVRRMESANGPPPSTVANLQAVQRAFEAAGIEFIPANGGGPGLRLQK